MHLESGALTPRASSHGHLESVSRGAGGALGFSARPTLRGAWDRGRQWKTVSRTISSIVVMPS